MTLLARLLVAATSSAGGVHRRRVERGSVSVELAILAIPIILLIVAAIVTGRAETAYSAVAIAAHDAARAASISRTGQAAADRAETVARATLTQQGLTCSTIDVEVDVSQFTRPVGQPAAVTATVTCHLNLDDLGFGYTRSLVASFTSAIDTWRARSS